MSRNDSRILEFRILEFRIVYLNLHGNFYIDLRKFFITIKNIKNILTKKRLVSIKYKNN